jgi:hypothetical protein
VQSYGRIETPAHALDVTKWSKCEIIMIELRMVMPNIPHRRRRDRWLI